MLFEPESSEAMGFGFRCGFLGMLHMEIVQERLEREYDLNLITTAPTVVYEVLKTDGSVLPLDNPAKLPPVNQIEEIREPIILRQHPHAAGLRRQRDHAVRGKARRAALASSTWRPRCRSATSCRWPRWCSTSSTG